MLICLVLNLDALSKRKKIIMGQKANINSLSVSYIKDWCSSWFLSNIDYSKILFDDFFILTYCKNLNVINLKILRYSNIIIIYIYVINLPNKISTSFFLKSLLKNNYKRFDRVILIFRKHSFHALTNSPNFCALQICLFIENRLKFKSNVIKTFLKTLLLHNKGIKVKCKGRLNNVDMAKSESIVEGKISLQSFSKPISYGFCVANTLKGLQSVKVWLLQKL